MEWVTNVATLAVGIAIGWYLDRLRRGAAYQRRDEIIEQAKREAENIRKAEELAAKEELLKRREELEAEIQKQRDELREEERKLIRREEAIEERQQEFVKRERMLDQTHAQLSERQKAIEVRERELDRILRQEQEQLYKISGLSKDAATEMLLDRLDRQLREETGALILKHRAELKERAEEMAREIVGMALQRVASQHTAEMTVSTVDIPNDEMKGRIIGREGRNIRAFEKITGVDVIVDDTPGVVVVSAFDKVRREVARLSLVKLIQDGRIHPSRIEEVVQETQQEIEAHIRRLGQQACQEAGITGLHEKLVEMMGRLHFRTSYSQNVLRHSIEVAFLTGLIAEQLGLDAQLARRCGFLHDIGKAADHEMEGGHPAVGAELLKRYGEPPEVVHAAAGHHDDIRPEYPYTVLVAAADAISAARPGARRETLERYIKRLEELEALACGFPGVEQAYAVQAGREVRVIVDSKKLNDREAAKLARDIAKAIEETLTYPGEIKVSVLRETRAVQYAR
ncbi:MAG: ribonuclease Y [Planctomycetota bacterium]|nr:MAG: ribonuclease Y [Planctomycetota bacterium]